MIKNKQTNLTERHKKQQNLYLFLGLVVLLVVSLSFNVSRLIPYETKRSDKSETIQIKEMDYEEDRKEDYFCRASLRWRHVEKIGLVRFPMRWRFFLGSRVLSRRKVFIIDFF